MPIGTSLSPHTTITPPRCRALLAVALATSLVAGTGCSSWQPLTAASSNGLVEDRPVRFHMGQEAYEVQAKAKHGPLVLADVEVPGEKPEPVAVDLRLVQGAEVYAPVRGRKALIAVGSAVGGAGIIAIVVAAVVAGMKSGGGFGSLR